MPVVELKFNKVKDKELPNEKINLVEFITVKGLKAKGNKLSYSKLKEVTLLPPVEVPIDDDVLDEFEESGLSPLEALKKSTAPEKKNEKNILSIDQLINAEIKLPSAENKKKKSMDDGESQTELDL